RRQLVTDAVAGITVGLVALPLAMAFGIASGVTPQAGIYTAIVGGVLVSALLMVTMMAGVILLFLAFTGLGQAVKFIPRPVVLGFTNGIALLIASTQIRDFLGLRLPENPSEFAARIRAIAQ